LQETDKYQGSIHNKNGHIFNFVIANKTPLSKPRSRKENDEWLENNENRLQIWETGGSFDLLQLV
jgi:hypothetical protein